MSDTIANFVPHPNVASCKDVYDLALAEFALERCFDTPPSDLHKDPAFKYRTWYAADYVAIFSDIKAGLLPERDTFAYLIQNDLFFIVHFVMNIGTANKPFVVEKCRMVEEGPQSGTVDIWAREHFKAIDINEPVPTPSGWKLHGELQVGDFVYGGDGNPAQVVAKTEIFTKADCYKITFDDGYSITCSGDHLWTVEAKTRKRISGTTNGRKYRETVTIPTKEIYLNTHAPDKRIAIRVAPPVGKNDVVLPISPYVFGAWLGDGHSANGRVTVPEVEIRDNIIACGYECGPINKSMSATVYKIHTNLRKLGVINNKHIPSIYMNGSITQRQQLLQGLMDTDGTVNTRGTATFTNINYQLSKDVWQLCCSLGLKPSLRTHISKVNGMPYTFYMVSFQAYKNFPVFKLNRKMSRCKEGERTARRFVISCEKVESIPVSCIQVSNADGLYLVGENHVTTHNSTTITIGRTVQRIVNDPECTTAIFSYKKGAAEKFLDAIRKTLESQIMIWAFPHILYENPSNQAKPWGLEVGIRVKRKSTSRKEHTVEAFGLVDGMPTGGHWDHLIWDDVETDDMAASPDQLDLCFKKLQMSYNLGREGGTDQIIGTYYSHCGVLVKLGDMKKVDGSPMYNIRIFPGTEDGTIHGRPVLFSQDYLDSKKTRPGFNTQILCNPTPAHDVKLKYENFVHIKRKDLPQSRIKIIIIDPAGDKDVQMGNKNDSWAMLCIGVEPVMDDMGISNIYLEDAIAGEMSSSESTDAACTIYMRNGRISMLGVERVGTDSAWLHIKKALAARGRYLELKKKGQYGGNLMLLAPAGRSKNKKIIDNLEWPLNNSKIHLVDDLPDEIINKIMNEVAKFPFFHVDILDALAYVYDVLADPEFVFHKAGAVKRVPDMSKVFRR